MGCIGQNWGRQQQQEEFSGGSGAAEPVALWSSLLWPRDVIWAEVLAAVRSSLAPASGSAVGSESVSFPLLATGSPDR